MKRNEEKRRKRRRIRWIVLLSFLLILASAAFTVIHFYKVTDVEVEGNELYEDEKIKEWVLNDKYSWNTLYVYLKYRFLKTEEVPFIDTMDITMTNAHTLKVMVYEKGLIGYLYEESLGQNVYFDKDGFVIELSPDVIAGVPQITGITCESVTIYKKLDLTGSILKTLLTVTQTLEKYELAVDNINYDNTGNMILTFGTVMVDVGNGDNFAEKVMRLQKILPQVADQSGILHLENWNEDTTDITFEKNTE